MRFDFESKAFDATHCVCKDQFVGDLCETQRLGVTGDYTDFIAAVNECLTVDPVHGICPDSAFGVMSDWDVSLVSNFAEAFRADLLLMQTLRLGYRDRWWILQVRSKLPGV